MANLIKHEFVIEFISSGRKHINKVSIMKEGKT